MNILIVGMDEDKAREQYGTEIDLLLCKFENYGRVFIDEDIIPTSINDSPFIKMTYHNQLLHALFVVLLPNLKLTTAKYIKTLAETWGVPTVALFA